MHYRSSPALIVILILAGLSGVPRPAQATSVTHLIQSMTLEQKVGQLFIIRAWGKTPNALFTQLIQTMQPGGVVLLSENIDTAEQVAAFTSGLQQTAQNGGVPLPLLVLADQEGGSVQRLRNGFTRLPAPLLLGAITDPAALTAYGEMVGRELRAVGVNMNLSPVVDLATTPNNPVVSGRMLGDDPARVAAAATHLIAGMARAGVAGVLKHFPGHGDIQDTHVGRSVLSYGKSRLYATELLPFFKARAGAIMLGHIEAPALDDSGLPATLSAKMVSILRDEAGFDGVLITDAMDMGAIADRYSLSVASVMAVRAGVDLILLGSHTPIDKQIAAYRAVLDAARGDKTLEARIDAAVQRIIRFKNNHGLGAWSAFTMSNPVPDIHLDASAEVLGNTYAAALTLVRNTDGLLPVGANQKVLINYPKEYPAIRRACTSVQIAQTEYNAVSFLPLNYELGVAAALAKKADVIIVFTENARVNTAQRRLVAALSPTRTVVIALGSPYDNQVLPDVAGYALTYGAVEPAFVAACAGIFGQEGWRGVLPVRLGEQYPAGWKAR